MQRSVERRLAELERWRAARSDEVPPPYVTQGPDGVWRRPDGRRWEGTAPVKGYTGGISPDDWPDWPEVAA